MGTARSPYADTGDIDWGDAPNWIAAVAATIAAVASVAVWRQSEVEWEVQLNGPRAQLVNVGGKAARRARLWVGPAEESASEHAEEHYRSVVQRTESVAFSNYSHLYPRVDWVVRVTWRGLLRDHSRTYPVA